MRCRQAGRQESSAVMQRKVSISAHLAHNIPFVGQCFQEPQLVVGVLPSSTGSTLLLRFAGSAVGALLLGLLGLLLGLADCTNILGDDYVV